MIILRFSEQLFAKTTKKENKNTDKCQDMKPICLDDTY